MTLYALKPRFQDLLRPMVAVLPRIGVTANLVTLLTALGSVLVGFTTAWQANQRSVFLIIPLWLFVRMALNAMDGMLACEGHQQSALGGYLNELGDVVSDVALYAPFAFIPPFDPLGVALIIVLSILTEFAGALGPACGASRRYDGPLGKSDRAVLFGALGAWVAISPQLPPSLKWSIPLLAALLVLTTLNRIRAGLSEASKPGDRSC
jgi:CDP-diacylglycerol--glycerol-3-phosphate 3-phosphatidyltransferase